MRQFPKFRKFKSIRRFSRSCIITEKIDGSNAQICITDDGQVYAGSRNRWLSPGKGTDNYGFAAWVEDNAGVLQLLGPGRHFGEWFGKGINRGYGMECKLFALFNVSFWKKLKASSADILSNIGVRVVPVITVGIMTSDLIEEAMEVLKVKGSLLVRNFSKPEGIVIYHCDSGTLFKKTLEND